MPNLSGKLSSLIGLIHKALGDSSLAVNFAVKLRNQCGAVIGHRFNDGIDLLNNGEFKIMKLISPYCYTYVDVGANRGDWTALFLDVAKNIQRGFLIEPSKTSIEYLRTRFKSFTCLEFIDIAAADFDGEQVFFEEINMGETSSLVKNFCQAGAKERIVKVKKIDTLAAERGLQTIDFLKIDAEGYDLKVLRGAHQLISQNKIGMIQFEYNSPWALAGSTLADAYTLLEASGYNVFLLKSSGLYQLDYNKFGEYFNYSNYIAVLKEKMELISPFLKGSI